MDQKSKPTRITQVEYGMSVNVGNYESVKFSLTAQVPEGDDWREVLAALMRKCSRIKAQVQDEHAPP